MSDFCAPRDRAGRLVGCTLPKVAHPSEPAVLSQMVLGKYLRAVCMVAPDAVTWCCQSHTQPSWGEQTPAEWEPVGAVIPDLWWSVVPWACL
jgi:hypothetical protein